MTSILSFKIDGKRCYLQLGTWQNWSQHKNHLENTNEVLFFKNAYSFDFIYDSILILVLTNMTAEHLC